jgi:hypothetical protein
MTAGNTVKLIASVNITIASSVLFLRRYEATKHPREPPANGATQQCEKAPVTTGAHRYQAWKPPT